MKTKLIKSTVVTLAAIGLFWFWFPRHYRFFQHLGAVIETHDTPTTNE